ncbi:MAG: (deoxy)nucleoside triphosphate pyrophosphohydrolase [Bdellovibrionales bacterium]|nr:(deoxy)nucleoside triphosphate pyrophosphohydrolase [Bdellovibrionales bacterium]
MSQPKLPKYRIAAAAIVCNGRILIARRKPGKNLEGFWEFPGGKIEKNETSEQCLKRELNEELGLKTVSVQENLIKIQHRYPQSEIEMDVFLCSLGEESEVPTIFESHDRVEWAMVEDLKHYEWAPADLPAVRLLMDRAR